eukprot:jgi/Tetstr1/465037/TSEL_009765.t1
MLSDTPKGSLPAPGAGSASPASDAALPPTTEVARGMPPFGFEGDVDTPRRLDVAMVQVEASQKAFARFTQEQVDHIFREVAREANMNRVQLAQYAVADTGKGVVEDKVVKNHFASEFVYNKFADLKTCDVIRQDMVKGVTEIAEPIGPIAGIIPVTNPTSTVIFKALIALKTRNCIVFSPHPSAARACAYTAELLRRAAVRAGAPDNCIRCVSSDRDTAMGLLSHPATKFTLATGGPGIVSAVYKSGKPAIGVGPGNAPAIIDEFADLQTAVSSIVLSKTFDNGMICASENSVIAVESVYDKTVELFRARGCHMLSPEETHKVSSLIIQDGHLNARVVGQSAARVAELAGVRVPPGTVALIGTAASIGAGEPMSYEKLCPVIGLYKAADYEAALDMAEAMVEFGGKGHTAALYTDHQRHRERIDQLRARVPACKILVDQPTALGAIGDVYNFALPPSLTLGCGAKGGSSVSSNVGPEHLLDVKTVAERRENMLWFKVPRSIYYKRGIVAEAARDLDAADHRRLVVVTDRVMVELGHADRVAAVFRGRGMQVSVFDGVTPDPTVECIARGVDHMRSFAPDTVLALGGGSPMDAAKIMRLMYEHPEVGMEDLAARFMDIRKRVFRFPAAGTKVRALICVPTTSGTGAEITPFAVVTDTDGRKYPICDYSLTPDMALVDPDFTDGMPPGLTAATGYDALTHAVESLVSIVSTDYTEALSTRAIKLSFKYLERAYRDGGDDEVAREKMHNASAIAGMAFANAFLGLCHSMAHQLGAQFHIPHGVANALCLSHVVAFNATDCPVKMAAFPQYRYPDALRRYAEVAETLGIAEGGMSDEEKTWRLIEELERLKAAVGLPASIAEAGVSEEEFEAKLDTMAMMAFDDQCTAANPRYPLITEIKDIYRAAYRGRPLAMGAYTARPFARHLAQTKQTKQTKPPKPTTQTAQTTRGEAGGLLRFRPPRQALFAPRVPTPPPPPPRRSGGGGTAARARASSMARGAVF